MLETTFNREKENKMKAKSCFSLNADFNNFSDVSLRGQVHVDGYRFFLSIRIEPKEYWLLQMLTQQTAKIWKKIKRCNLKNEKSCSEENKRSVSWGRKSAEKGGVGGVVWEELV